MRRFNLRFSALASTRCLVSCWKRSTLALSRCSRSHLRCCSSRCCRRLRSCCCQVTQPHNHTTTQPHNHTRAPRSVVMEVVPVARISCTPRIAPCACVGQYDVQQRRVTFQLRHCSTQALDESVLVLPLLASADGHAAAPHNLVFHTVSCADDKASIAALVLATYHTIRFLFFGTTLREALSVLFCHHTRHRNKQPKNTKQHAHAPPPPPPPPTPPTRDPSNVLCLLCFILQALCSLLCRLWCGDFGRADLAQINATFPVVWDRRHSSSDGGSAAFTGFRHTRTW